MNTCETCKYWKQEETLGTCSNPKFYRGYNWDEDEDVPSDCVLVEDDEGWAFLTGSDFGCIHWKQK